MRMLPSVLALAAIGLVGMSDQALAAVTATPPAAPGFGQKSRVRDKVERVPYTGMNRQQRRAMERGEK